MSDVKVLRVVGLTFQPGYPDTMHRLADLLVEWHDWDRESKLTESLAVVLIREPDNPHDPNAVQVHIPALNRQVGHLSRADAAIVAPYLDSHEWRVRAWVARVRIKEDKPQNPGLDVGVLRTPKE